MLSSKARADLERRKNILQTALGHLGSGWARGHLDDGHTVCAIGALNRARYQERPTSHDVRYRSDRSTADLAANINLPSTFNNLDTASKVVYFNDRLAHHKGDVVALFEKTIKGIQCVLDQDTKDRGGYDSSTWTGR